MAIEAARQAIQKGDATQRRMPAFGFPVAVLKKFGEDEIGEMAGAKAKGVGFLAAAAALGLFVIGFLGLAAAAALDLVLPRWASLLIVGVAYLFIAVIAALVGRQALKTNVSPRTKQTVKEDVEWAKQQLRR
jgi:hypothetical protein